MPPAGLVRIPACTMEGAGHLLEGCVVGLQHGLVSQYGRAASCAQVGGVSVDVVGRRTVEFVYPLQQELLPALQGLQHGVAQRRGDGQVCDTQNRHVKRRRAASDTLQVKLVAAVVTQ